MSNDLTKKRSWFATHAHYGTSQFIFNTFLVVTLIECVILEIIFFASFNAGHNFDMWPRQGCPGLDSIIFISMVPLGELLVSCLPLMRSVLASIYYVLFEIFYPSDLSQAPCLDIFSNY